MRTYQLGVIRELSSLVALLLLAACGGGGGGGGSSGGSSGLTPPPSAPVAVTAANSTQVAATALEPAIGGGGALGAVLGVETTAAPKPRALTRTLLAVARDSKRQLSAPQIVVGVATTLLCAVSGSVTIDEDPSGTSGTITFNACSDVPGETLNGSASATGISGAPDGSSFAATFSLDVTFTETGFAPLRAVGGFSISETCNITTLDCTGTFTGASLGAARGSETWFISNFTIMEAELAGAITTTANYTVSSTALNGSVAVITTTSLLTAPGAQHPHVGVVVATGSNSSKVQVTVLGSNPTAADQVQIALDADGNGIFESTTPVSWSTLDAL